MKYFYYFFLFLFFLLLCLPCCSAWYNDYYVTPQGIWEIDKMNNSTSLFISLGTSKAMVIEAMGREAAHVTGGPTGQQILTYNDTFKEPAGMDFYINNDRLVAIAIYIETIPSDKGIHIGFSREEVIEAYGENYIEKTISGHGQGILYRTERGNMFFSLSGGRVTEIIIYFEGEW